MAINYWQDFEEGKTYHFYNKSISGIKLFKDETDYNIFLEIYLTKCASFFRTYAYCLIPNHFHILAEVRDFEDTLEIIENDNTLTSEKLLKGEITYNMYLQNLFQRLFSSYALKYKNRHSHEGPVFLRKFKRLAIDSERKLHDILCYIHHNPIHHGLVTKYEEWNYSSYRTYIQNAKTNIAKEKMLDWLGGIEVFINVHEDYKYNF